MGLSFSIKKRNGDAWEHIDLVTVAGKTLEEMFLNFEGGEIVAEVVVDGERFFFCGNGHWLERMQRKGKAVTFLQAVDMLRSRCPHLLGEKILGVQEITEVFSGPSVDMETCSQENSASKFDA